MKKTNNNSKIYINKDGKQVMRVTEVIKMLSKDQLIFWANMLGFKKISYKQELERTSNIGSLVHDVLENYMNPKMLSVIDFNEYKIDSYNDKIEVHRALHSFSLWYKELIKSGKKYDVMFTEMAIVGDSLGGTIDCGIRGFSDPNKLIFVDYKTSSSIYLTMFLQLCAYVMIYEELHGPDTIEGVMVIQMDKKYGNKANARFISRNNLEIFITAFRALMSMTFDIKTLEKTYWEFTESI